ncbi:hypothetical protein N5915_08600 [Arcobacter lacus]|uniref:Uncharacterized protein n=1 Tax=Arcobacter lacus TaxID=1912876 RepID=A0ABX5JHW7_9BACT|nr:hypothetical protein [Arcobacter lacus]MCT7909615.1 hypothetical protein [Arcobacter lacus]MCT7911616.1 hypothetical protein [Arcobacter lacus]PUE66995.1 hypothetical protein B0175_03815 [Arcobacter lacus]
MFEIVPFIVINLVIALIIGVLIGYLIGKRNNSFKTIKSDSDEQVENKKVRFKINPIFNKSSSLDYKPMVLSSSSKIDNFKKIKGINSQIEKNLYSLGIFHYEQISNWTNKNVEWIESFLELPFHVRNNQWVEQARILKNGNETTYSQQVENGEIEVD